VFDSAGTTFPVRFFVLLTAGSDDIMLCVVLYRIKTTFGTVTTNSGKPGIHR